MFICKECGVTESNQRQYKISTAIRNVDYIEQVQLVQPDGTSKTKIIKKSKGTEIVKEVIYCQEHAPKIEPIVTENITRIVLVGTKVLRKRAERLKIKKG